MEKELFKKGDYKLGNNTPCLNIVLRTIDYYKTQPEPYRLKTILLNREHWLMFAEEMKLLQELPENHGCEIDAEKGIQIEGCDVTVKRGSMFQDKELKYEFYPSTRKVLRPNHKQISLN
jgi:hypothetical protein